MGRPYLRLELGGGEAAKTHVGALFVVVPPPAFDPDLGLHPVPKPLEGQAFVPELPGCFRHQLLLSRPYLLLTKALTPSFRHESSCEHKDRL